MTHHNLKTDPHYFTAVWDGDKPFEVRYDDRGYQAGDTVTLLEHDHTVRCERQACIADARHGLPGNGCERYTGRQVAADITYVLAQLPGKGSRPDFQGRGYVILGLSNIECTEAVPPPTPGSAAEAMARVAAGGAR